MRALVLWIAVAACGGQASRTTTPELPPLDEQQSEKDARGLVREIYDTIDRGKTDNLFSLLDDTVVVFGPRGGDALGNRTDTLVALGNAIAAIERGKKKLGVRSGRLEVVAASGGRSAWAVDVVSIAGVPHAVTAIAANTDDLWQLQVAHVAQMPRRPVVVAELEKSAVVPPAARANARVDGAAKGAVERFQRGLLEQELWADDLTTRDGAVVIGPIAGEVARGKKAVKKLWRKRLDARTRAAIAGELVAATTPDGQLAWVTAPITRVDDDNQPLPLRAFAVFERANDSWAMVALHEALALGEPGEGSAFVKSVKDPEPAPAAADPEPAPKKQATTKKPKKKKSKKKKKKKKPRPDDDDDE
jgi:ketosteroid isomerase-like protein